MSKRLAKYFDRNIKNVYWLIGLLLITHWLVVLLSVNGYDRELADLSAWFDLDREYNLPTFTNSMLLGMSSLTALTLAVRSRLSIHRLGWCLLSLLFGYFALDELLIIHEQLAEPVRKLLNISGSNPLYHAWVVPAIVIVAILSAVIYLINKHYRHLKDFAGILLLIAILGAGVVTAEIVGTFVYPYTLAYRLLMVPAEEVFELLMATQILRSLLQHLNDGTRQIGKKTQNQK